jgi:hypothetical protein
MVRQSREASMLRTADQGSEEAEAEEVIVEAGATIAENLRREKVTRKTKKKR